MSTKSWYDFCTSKGVTIVVLPDNHTTARVASANVVDVLLMLWFIMMSNISSWDFQRREVGTLSWTRDSIALQKFTLVKETPRVFVIG
ncbi:MAG: hypothetical protein WAK17_03850 [Candidatus Nitrosopolaris sp.]